MHLSKACSQYGASMGRRSDASLEGKCSLRQVKLDRGGYDSGGAYWGTGETLWRAQDENGREMFFRATDRIAAKAHVLSKHHGVRFYR